MERQVPSGFFQECQCGDTSKGLQAVVGDYGVPLRARQRGPDRLRGLNTFMDEVVPAPRRDPGPAVRHRLPNHQQIGFGEAFP